MKPLLIIVMLVLVGVLVFVQTRPKTEPASPPSPSIQAGAAAWQGDIPEGTTLVPKGQARLNVQPMRRTDGNKVYLDFHITEEHGYMVDGVRVEFWYRYKDDDSDAWIEDSKRVDFFIRERLPFNETLVASTVLLNEEFEHLKLDLAATTTENWQVRIVDYNRAMQRAP